MYGTDQNETFLGRDLGAGRNYSETVASEIDSEIRDMLDSAFETARKILAGHMEQLHAVAKSLLEREKLSGEEFNVVMDGGELPPLETAEEPTIAPTTPIEIAPTENA